MFCRYCVPQKDLQRFDKASILSFEEIEFVVSVAASLGVTKLRITGGEPLVRKGVTTLIQRLSAIPGIEQIALTTNGMLLEPLAESLKQAGVARINISLDSLDPDRFREITRTGDLQKVLRGLQAAARVGMKPIKINCVLTKKNLDEIQDFILLAEQFPYWIRFIEYMPIGNRADHWKDTYIPLTSVSEMIQSLGWKEIPPISHHTNGNGPAAYYHKDSAAGRIGFIQPVSNSFCQTCNRLRLTADGFLKPCLFWNDEFNIRNCMGDEKKLERLFFKALQLKPESHEMEHLWRHQPLHHTPTKRYMYQIGG